MAKKQVGKKAAPAKSSAKKPAAKTRARKAEKSPAVPSPSENVRCRICRIVDGYTDKEQNCRFCGSKLFKGDVV